MNNWLASWKRFAAIAVVPVITSVVLLIVSASEEFSERSVAASLLILGFAVFGVSGMLFTGRAIWKWPIGQTAAYLRWERSFVIAAVLATALGLTLLEDMLDEAGASGFAPVSLVTYLIGAVVLVVAETTFLSSRDWVYSQVVIYVVLAFLAQAGFGVCLLQTGLVAEWVGWLTIVWNLGWLVVLSLASPRNVYYPAFHHAAPLLIGLSLL
ncbi:MAG: hypothetical protein M5U05_19500 [Anaerolineales bacterium]|nr:hypothetical protein [Anaerolineales bacterium]